MSPDTSQKSSRPDTPRAAARARTMCRIVELGNAQLVEHGAADLSVREIARGLGMVSSAIYRYVRSRDDLLTLLIVDAFGHLAGAVDEAVAAAGSDPRARFLALGSAMTGWAIENPERWTLLYGTPVRGYAAPAETTNAPGTRVMGQMLVIAADAAARSGATSSNSARAGSTGAESAGAGSRGGPFDPELVTLFEGNLAEVGVEIDTATAVRAVTAWSSLVGVISAHVFGQLGADIAAVGQKVLEIQILHLADLVASR